MAKRRIKQKTGLVAPATGYQFKYGLEVDPAIVDWRPLAKVEIRELVRRAVAQYSQHLPELIDRVARRDPAKAVQLVIGLAEFCTPKLQKVDMIQQAPVEPKSPAQERIELEATLKRLGLDPKLILKGMH